MKLPTLDDLADDEPLAPEVPATPGPGLSRSAKRYLVAVCVLAALVGLGLVGAAALTLPDSAGEALAETSE